MTDHFNSLGYEEKGFKPRRLEAMMILDPQMTSAEVGMVGVGGEVFILGYPLGLSNQGVMPVWKRGSVASEPWYNIVGNAPVFYVDATTRAGMSGSPVLAVGAKIISSNGNVVAELSARHPWLLGVYAGRDGSMPDELDMALGRVWKHDLLNSIFFHQVPGGSPPRLGPSCQDE